MAANKIRINGITYKLEGSGGGSSIDIDSSLSSTSTNPVQNRVISAALSEKIDRSELPKIPQITVVGGAGESMTLQITNV